MNKLVKAIKNSENKTVTANGDKAFKSTLNAVLDFFYFSGAARQIPDQKVIDYWSAAFNEDNDLAIRALLYLRDIREGLGERKVSRTILTDLAKNTPDVAIKIIPKVTELGRWDDLLEMINGNKEVAYAVFNAIDEALNADDSRTGLCAKWMPRKGVVAARIRNFIGYNEREWRKLLVAKTNVVETQMCAREWTDINYSAVPSIASGRYAKAFGRHDAEGYVAYLESVKTGKVNEKTGKVEKINTEALYPYSVASMPRDTAQVAWDNLRDFVKDQSFIPMIDTSGSMTWTYVSPGLTPLDVAVPLGAYMAEKNKSAFKDYVLTFTTNPEWIKVDSSKHIHDRFNKIKSMNVGGSTDFDKAINDIVDKAIKNNVPQEDMPSFLIVFSDMQFNSYMGGKTAAKRTKEKFKEAGYNVPTIVWWNLNSEYGNVPVKADSSGMILVSGFSPALMQNLLSGEVTPIKMMLNTLNKERYNWV